MSAESRDYHKCHKSQTQTWSFVRCQFGHSVHGKCCHHQGCKPVVSSKPRSNSAQFPSSNNYLKRLTNLRPANSDQHRLKTHRKGALRQWEESRRKTDLEQRQESKPWKAVEQKEGVRLWEELLEVESEEHDDVLIQGEELGCGENLAHGNELDWQVGLEQGEEFDSGEGNSLLEILDKDKKQRVAGQFNLENERKEGRERSVNGKTRWFDKAAGGHFAMQPATLTLYEQIVLKAGKNRNTPHTSVKLSNTNHFYTTENTSDDLSADRTDIFTMFPDVCDAGEALADAEGFLECDLFEHTEPSQTLESKESDTVMLLAQEGSESTTESLSTFGEEIDEETEDMDPKDQREATSPFCANSQDSLNSDSTVYPMSEREIGILSEFSYHSSSSFASLCSSEPEMTFNEVERTETSENHRHGQERPEAEQIVSLKSTECVPRTFQLGLPCGLLTTVLQPEEQTPQLIQEKHCDGQDEKKIVTASGTSEDYIEEHIYEETEPKFQTKDFLQTRRYLMTRSISVEPPNNRLDPLSTAVSGKERLMLHPQSYHRHHLYLGESLPALTGSLGCLSPSRPCPPTMDIPPPFELSSITKRPIRKSTPALPNDVTACTRKSDFGFKRYFLPSWFLRKTERKTDNRSVSSRSSSESSPHGSCKKLNVVRQSAESPILQRTQGCSVPSSPSSFYFKKNSLRHGLNTPLNNHIVPMTPSSWDLLRMEPDDLANSLLVQPLTLSKPRSFSSPNVDSSVYENVVNTSPHYENVQVRILKPSNQMSKNPNSASDTDGYVDMSSLPGFISKTPLCEQETESAYTICSPTVRSDGTVSVSVGVVCAKEEENCKSNSLTVNCSRAYYTVKELLDSETQHVKTLKLLNEAINADEQLINLWSDVPVIYTLHQDLHTQLETRIKEWDQNERISDILLAKQAEFGIFSPFISQHDCRVKTMEQMEDTQRYTASLKQQLLQVIIRVLQYRLLLTDYMNNLSLHSKEYVDIQAVLVMASNIADQTKENLTNGVDLLRLVHIEHNIQGLKNLLQPGRAFVKEGTLMKVSRKCKQPRYLFLMSDILLYTYPQQDGKYRLINTLTLTGMEVTKLLIENTQNALKIEVKDLSIILSASSSIERDDWFVTLNRTIADLSSVLAQTNACFEPVEKSAVCLGDNAPPLTSVSQVAVCMNCPVIFSLTHRRHHCHACGKVVCRDCCRNKVPLKYMKNRRAKVCDKCYSELSKNKGDAAMLMETCSRPLSSVFQNIHPTSLWKSRKGHVSFNQVTGSEGEMSGNLQRSRNSKRNWKSLWFHLKDKVLYTYPQPEERVACESLPLLGFSVKSENEGESSVFQLYHNTTLYYTFKAQDTNTAQRWVSAMEEATVL